MFQRIPLRSLTSRPHYLPKFSRPSKQWLLRCAALSIPSVPRRAYSSDVSVQTKFGQPIHETHPHLLKPGELTPGCSALEYSMRRAKLASELPEGGIAILASADIKYRSGPVFYEFHQDPDFLYLTGFLEPESVCVIEKTGHGGEHNFHLFVRGKDPKAELWDGVRSGVQAAVDVFNADEAGDSENLHAHITPIIEKAQVIYYDAQKIPPVSGFQHFFSQSANSGTLTSLLANKKTVPLKPVMHKLRVFKTSQEVKNMRTAGRISGRAYNEAMAKRFTTEKELWMFLEYRFKMGGCDGSAYVPVIAGGENALSIHYTRNDDLLRSGEMVLVDAGGEYGGYITDITRTWPVNGKFTPAQKDLYQAVLNVQRYCVSLCRENAHNSLDDIHTVAEQGLERELKDLGFELPGRALREILFPHHVGHFVGLDVHDCGSYSRGFRLKAGQCVTIEPGIYVPDDARWPKHFRNMGIRIEDSVCVGEEGPIVLSVEAVKEVVDIEALGQKQQNGVLGGREGMEC